MIRRIAATWPFDIRQLPFFYGWVIWLISMLGFLFSIPGQTMGMAVFTDPLIEALGLSRTQLSMAYLTGTLGSSLLLTRAGRWYDQVGGRLLVPLSSLALALMLLFIAMTDSAAALLGDNTFVTFFFITIGYFGVRFFGQGVLTNCSRNILLLWFEKRRGLVTSVRGLFVSFGFSIAPLGLAWLIASYGWRGALWILALSCVGFAVVALILLRDNPTDCEVSADGRTLKANANTIDPISISFEQARRSATFWIYSLSLSIHAMFGTAVTFHIVSLFAEAGRSAEAAFGYFFPAAIVSTSTNLLCGWLADSRPLKPFLILMLVSFIGGAFGLLNLDQTWGYWLLVGGFGLGGGLWSVISSLGFIRHFGPLQLGEITGLCTSVMVFGSAIGPALFSLGLDHFGTYAAAEWACIAGLVLLLITALIMTPAEEPDLSGH